MSQLSNCGSRVEVRNNTIKNIVLVDMIILCVFVRMLKVSEIVRYHFEGNTCLQDKKLSQGIKLAHLEWLVLQQRSIF